MKLIEISEVRTATDGRQFFVARFRPALGQRSVARTFWEQFKRDPKTGELTSLKYWDRISPSEAKAALMGGEVIEGKKITHKVEKYQVGDNIVDTYSTVIFPDETPEALFSNQNHPIVDETTGEVLGKKKAVLAPSSSLPGGENEEGQEGGEEEEQEREQAQPRNTARNNGNK